jgi:hypothetical protein
VDAHFVADFFVVWRASGGRYSRIFDGQIKAPPSVGLHVVGFVEEIAMALRRGLLATLPKI